MLHVAEGAGGGVFVANGSADWLQHFSSNGPLRGEWSVRGLLDTVSVTNVFGTSRSEVYVITADASRRTVLRQDESGGHIVSWSVDDRAYDLTVNHYEGRIEGMVYVAHDNKAGSDDRSVGHVVRYFPTGKPDVRWDFATEVRGMDLKGDGTIWLGLLSSDTEPAHLLHLAPDRRVLRRCELEGEPVDLAVGPDDDVFVIRHWGSDPYDLNYEVLRISSECEEVDAWSQQQLSRQLWTITPQPSDRTPSASVGRSIHFPIALSD
jgi:hypothetical protein